jgi:beta-lactamase class A
MITTEHLAHLAAGARLSEPSIVVEALAPDGAPLWRAALDAERPTYPASMIKLPVALALARLSRQRAVRLDDRVVVDAKNMTVNDAPSPFVPGYEATLEELARAMLAGSDNVATNVLIDVLDREAIGRTCASLGLPRTAVRRKLSGALPLIEDPGATGRNAHPAADAALALRLVAGRRGELEPAWIRDALLAQIWNGKLSRGWGPGDVFAHKTGDTDEVSHDGGILCLEDGRRFVVVVYTELPSSPATDERFAEFATRLRPLLTDPASS